MNAREKFQRAFELRQYVEVLQVSDDQLYSEAYQRAADLAAEQLAPYVGNCLLENWRGAGYQSRTGTMEGNLKSPVVKATVRGKTIRLQYYMNPQSKPYDQKTAGGKTEKKSAFTVAGALNYGAVRMTKAVRKVRDSTGLINKMDYRAPIGSAAKRTIKKIAMTGTASARAIKRLTLGTRSKYSDEPLTHGFHLGKVIFAKQNMRMGTSVHFSSSTVVIPAKVFFQLKPSQNLMLGNRYINFLLIHLRKESTNAR